MPVGQGWSELVRKEGAAGWASSTSILCKMGSKVLQIRTRGSPITRFPLTHIPLIQCFATLQVRQGWSELVRNECAAGWLGWASATSILCKMGSKPLQIHKGVPNNAISTDTYPIYQIVCHFTSKLGICVSLYSPTFCVTIFFPIKSQRMLL